MFNKLFGKKEVTAPTKISLEKRVETFKVSLDKTNIGNRKFQVEIVMDRSGSMDWMYDNGTVKDTYERIMAIALTLDDNGELGSYAFHNRLFNLPNVTHKNYENYVKTNIEPISSSGTSYAPFIGEMIQKYKSGKIDNPALCIVFTDGECDDENEAEILIKEASNYPVFFKFIGLGNESFRFLRRLDDVSGRYVDNADFKQIQDIKNTSDSELYDMILDELEGWVKSYNAKAGN